MQSRISNVTVQMLLYLYVNLNVTVQMLLYLYVNLRLMNKLTSEMSNFLSDTMRDSNSHEFEEMVDPITCTPNEEPEENIVEIDETFSVSEHARALNYHMNGHSHAQLHVLISPLFAPSTSLSTRAQTNLRI